MAQEGTVTLTLTAKNLASEAFTKVQSSLRQLEQQTETTTTKGKTAWGSWFTTIAGGVAVGNLIGQAFSSAAGHLAKVPGQLIELGKRGSDVDDVTKSFRGLQAAIGETSTDTLAGLRRAFGGTVSDFDLMKSANEVLGKGVRLTADDFSTLAKGARVMADQVGGKAKDSFDSLLKAIGTGQERGLKQLPLDFTRINQALEVHAQKLGVSTGQLTEHEKRLVMQQAVLAETKRLIEENGEVTNDFADNIEAMHVQVSNWTDALGVGIATAPTLNVVLGKTTEAMGRAFGTDTTSMVQNVVKVINQVVIWTLEAGKAGTQAAQVLVQAWGVIQTPVRAVATAMLWTAEQSAKVTASMLELASAINPLDRNMAKLAESARQNADRFTAWREEGQRQTAASIEMAKGQDRVSVALQKTEGFLDDLIVAAREASKETVTQDQVTAALARRRTDEEIPALKNTTTATDGLTKKLQELNEKLGLAARSQAPMTDQVRQFGAEALKAANEAAALGIKVPEAVQKMADAFRAFDHGQWIEEVRRKTNEIGQKIYEGRVAALAKQQDAELKGVADLIIANQQYQDDLAVVTMRGVDRQIAVIERAKQAEIDALPVRTAANARFYDERVRQIKAHYGHEIAIVRGTADTIEERMRALGVATRRELQESAAAAARDYGQMRESGLYTAEQLERAWVEMIQRQAEALGGWKGAFLDLMSTMPNRLSSALAEMITQKRGFRDGVKGILEGIRDDFNRVLEDMLRQFLQGFLAKMLSGLLGSRPQFASAWGSILPGMGGGGLGIPGLPGWLGGGGAASAGGFGSGAGIAGSGSYTVGNLPGMAAGTPWWSTALGGGAIGGAAGAGVGWMVGSQTGNTWGSAGAGAGTGAGVGMMLGGPLGAGIGALIGGGVGWYRAKQENIKTNDVRDQFFLDYARRQGKDYVGGAGVGTTFHDVAAQLTAAGHGAGGGRLFQDLITQNDREGLAKAIEAVNKALAEYEARTKAATAAADDHAQQIAETTAQYEDQRQEVLANLADTQRQMGALVEDGLQEQERALLESLQTQAAVYQQQLKDIEAAQAAAIAGVTAAAAQAADAGADALKGSYDDAFSAIQDGARETGRSISEYLADRKAAFEVTFPDAPRHMGGGDYSVHQFAAGTDFRNFGRGEPAILHGEEAVVRRDQAGAFAAKYGPSSAPPSALSAAPVTVTLNVHITTDTPRAREWAERELVPIMTDIYRGDVRKARTQHRDALGLR